MRPIDTLPPPNWDDKLPAMAKFGLALLAAGVVYTLAQTVVALQRGSLPAALTAGGMLMMCSGFLATLAATWFTSPAKYAGSDTRGTTLRLNPYILWCWGVTLVAGVIGSACYLVFVSRGVAELPIAAPGRGHVNRYLMITLLALSLSGLVALVRRRGAAHLRIGPDGVENADIFRTRAARWADIVDVADKAENRSRNPIVLSLRNGKPIVIPNADRYEAGFGALYWMVRHYWKHPEARGELVDGHALERLRNEQYVAE